MGTNLFNVSTELNYTHYTNCESKQQGKIRKTIHSGTVRSRNYFCR